MSDPEIWPPLTDSNVCYTYTVHAARAIGCGRVIVTVPKGCDKKQNMALSAATKDQPRMWTLHSGLEVRTAAPLEVCYLSAATRPRLVRSCRRAAVRLLCVVQVCWFARFSRARDVNQQVERQQQLFV